MHPIPNAGQVEAPEEAPEEACYDVCIIGAGPHGLAVLSALVSSPISTSRDLSVCVVDPTGEWLHDWDARFAEGCEAFAGLPVDGECFALGGHQSVGMGRMAWYGGTP